ncbi:actin cortical patch SUR7/pH-response regulator pali [Penicillium malachiteum]|uniref:Actin cortical patch SUR7/pH-response regulator pali n=1 Tax=Penicillium malachiteum TaxID=1324776 RepID=A0AAD6MQK3_9EURO|nr:actin cortical patch SUR7/pH-response regulator pali [Penicillium malachiteum]
MSYCYGFEKECVLDDASNTTTIQRTIISCSDLNPLSRFDPGEALLEAIGESGSVSKTGWPSYLSDDFIALAPTRQAMAVMFILGTCAVGLSVLLRLGTVRYIWQPIGPQDHGDGTEPPSYPGYSRQPSPSEIPPSKLQLVTIISSTIILTIATAIATVISTQFVSLVDKSGNPGISAASTSGFLGMAWTTVTIQILLSAEPLISLLRYRARHCRCDWEELPAAPGPESKRLFSGHD